MTEASRSGADFTAAIPINDLVAALKSLWCMPYPAPDNLFSSPAFKGLAEVFGRKATTLGFASALHNIFRSVGAPFMLPPSLAHLACSPEQAAEAIGETFARTSTLRRYLCPLNLADTLPSLSFGQSRVVNLTAKELEEMLGARRLARFYPAHTLESSRLAQFQWLVVEERLPVDNRPEKRALPFLFEKWSRDIGTIDPHKGHFPQPVADALFFLLLAPWEDWAIHAEINWRGFQIPWVYVFDDDLSVRPPAPPDPDSLDWEPWIIDDEQEGRIELERPLALQLNQWGTEDLPRLDESKWRAVQAARKTPLFSTPIAHFLVQAFHLDGIDELLAHISAIEAALGMQADFKVPKTDPYRTLKATRRVMARIAALLDEPATADRFKTLFDIRSQFIHGRAGMGVISSDQRIEARRLARRVSAALVERALRDQRVREEILAELFADGMAMQSSPSRVSGSGS